MVADYTIAGYCGPVKGGVVDEDWTDEVDRLLAQVEGESDAEAARILDISESRFRSWRTARQAGERIVGGTRGRPRKALLRARAGREAESRVAEEVREAIDRYLPDTLRRAFLETTQPGILRGLHVVLLALSELPEPAKRVIGGDLDRRIREAETQH